MANCSCRWMTLAACVSRLLLMQALVIRGYHRLGTCALVNETSRLDHWLSIALHMQIVVASLTAEGLMDKVIIWASWMPQEVTSAVFVDPERCLRVQVLLRLLLLLLGIDPARRFTILKSIISRVPRSLWKVRPLALSTIHIMAGIERNVHSTLQRLGRMAIACRWILLTSSYSSRCCCVGRVVLRTSHRVPFDRVLCPSFLIWTIHESSVIRRRPDERHGESATNAIGIQINIIIDSCAAACR